MTETARPAAAAGEGPVFYARHGDVGVITIASPPVNALGREVRAGLLAATAAAAADADAVAVVVIGDGRTFPAGADITEFAGGLQPPDLNDVNGALEGLDKPTVAALHGTALGGGLELAMSCRWRIAVASARVGLPEVTLGILPGAGGTQRLPRLVGLKAALEIITSGAPVSAARAAALGLVDAVVEEPLLEAALAFARARAAEDPPPAAADRPVAADPTLIAAMREQVAAADRHAFAPVKCVDAVAAAADLPFAEGLARERALFEECRRSPQSAALIHAFFAERKAAKVEGLAPESRPRRLGSVAVIGAGTMGCGIAIACAAAGLPVALIETDAGALSRASSKVTDWFDGQAAKGRLDAAGAAQRAELISTASDLSAAGQADLVIEAVPEDMALKRDLFAALGRICRPEAILATNTSTLDVNHIAAATGAPERVVGLHFFSPAPVMRLLEIVRGAATADDVLASALAFARRLGKVGVVAGVCDGFIGNRMLEAYLREAYLLLEEGASPATVDAAVESWGFAMGPLRMMDMAGNDVGWRIRQQRGPLPEGVHGRLSRLPDLLCEAGRYGQKRGAGWYDYPDGPRRPVESPAVSAMIAAERARQGLAARPVGTQEMQQRLVLALINEGARLLEEGIAQRASDIDVVYLTGYGFPRVKGGPMWWADVLTPPVVLDQLRDLERRHGPRWTPAPLIERLARTGGRFG